MLFYILEAEKSALLINADIGRQRVLFGKHTNYLYVLYNVYVYVQYIVYFPAESKCLKSNVAQITFSSFKGTQNCCNGDPEGLEGQLACIPWAGHTRLMAIKDWSHMINENEQRH